MENDVQQCQNIQQRRKRPNVLVTGTPGTGKSSLSKMLGEYSGLEYNNVGEIISVQRLYSEWDNEFNCSIFDEDMLVDYLEPVLKREGQIVDFHSSSCFPLRWFDLVVLLRTNNTQLYDRLVERGYSQHKIDNNIQCEILEVLSDEVYSSYPKSIILELDNSHPQQFEQNLITIIEWLKQWKQSLL